MDCVVDKTITEHKIEIRSIILQRWLRGQILKPNDVYRSGQIFCVDEKDLWTDRKGNFDTRIEFRLVGPGVLEILHKSYLKGADSW